MMSFYPRFFFSPLVAFAAGLAPQWSQADVFELRGGGVITGQLLNGKEKDPAVLKIRTHDGLELELTRGQLAKAPRRYSAERELPYIKSFENQNETIDLHRKIVAECRQRGQKELELAHLERMVELDPSDKESWAALGYFTDSSGHWVRVERLNMSRGMVRKPGGGGWTTPQAAAIVEVERKKKEARAKLEARIDNELRNLDDSGPKGLRAQEFFQNLEDPAAVRKLTELVKQAVKVGGNTEFFMEILGRLPGNSATESFIQLSLELPNSHAGLIDQALAYLSRDERARDQAVNTYVEILRSKNKSIPNIQRAGRNLQVVGDKRAISALIDCLVVEQVVTITTPNTTAFSPTGGGVSQSTGGTQQSRQEVQNPSVLGALQEITHMNNGFGYNKALWRNWFASEYAYENLNLRRDE